MSQIQPYQVVKKIIMLNSFVPNLFYFQASRIENEIDTSQPTKTKISTWEKVSNWFCNTSHSVAKQNLLSLNLQKTTDQEKIANFFDLKKMAGANYQKNFSYEKSNDFEKYAINLDSGETIFSLTRQAAQCNYEAIINTISSDRTSENMEGALIKDLDRSVYLINTGGPTSIPTIITSLNDFHENLDELKCTQAEKASIFKVVNQSVFGIIMNNAPLTTADYPLCPTGPYGLTYQICRTDAGKIRATAQSMHDFSFSYKDNNTDFLIDIVNMEDPNTQKSIEMKISIDIDHDGTMSIHSLDYWCNSDLSDYQWLNLDDA